MGVQIPGKKRYVTLEWPLNGQIASAVVRVRQTKANNLSRFSGGYEVRHIARTLMRGLTASTAYHVAQGGSHCPRRKNFPGAEPFMKVKNKFHGRTG